MAIKFDDILAGGAGAIDELLFGIPEFIAKKIDRQAVEGWIKKNEPAYRIGETAGTVGSMFLPGVGAIGKGIKGAATAAKLAKGADVALDVVKGVDTAADIAKGAKAVAPSLAKLAGRGALSGAAEAGVRGITSEKTPEQIAKDIQTGALFGAGGGALGGLLGKNAKRLAGEATKTAERAYEGATDLTRRQALGLLKDMAGPGAKGIGKFKMADTARKELVRVGKEIGAHIPGKMDEAILGHSATWDKLDEIVEAAMPGVRGSEIYKAAARKLPLSDLYDEFGEDSVKAFVKDIEKAGESRSGLANVRGYLQDVINNSFKPGTLTKAADAGVQRMERTIAQRLRSGIDEMVMDTAEKAGVAIDFKKLKRDYLPMRAIADAAANADVTPLRLGGGSPTTEKLGTALAMAGLGGAGAYGASEGDVGERLKKAAMTAGLAGLAGVGGKALSSLASKTATRGVASLIPVAQRAESAIGKIAPGVLESAGAMTGGMAASVIAREAMKQSQPTTPEQAEAAQAGAAAGAEESGTPQYYNTVLDKLGQYAASKGVSTDSDEFKQFVSQVYQASGGFKPEMIGGILYQDPAEREAYTKALSVAQRLKATLPGATAEGPGLLGGEGAEAGIQRKAAVDQLAALVGDVAKATGSEKAAKASLDKILAKRIDPAQKEELIKTLLAAYGVDVDQLYSMGVV